MRQGFAYHRIVTNSEKHQFGEEFLSRYEIGEKLGSGAFATVYSAVQKNLNRKVALKILNSNRLQSAEAKARFNREAMLLSKMSHPNIVRIFDFGLDDGRPFLVEEFVSGITLEEALKKDKVHSLADTVKICSGICSALAEAHEMGIVHRDLKPANVLLCEDEVIKLLDFGLAVSVVGQETRMTETGALIGTPLYMAPEQLLGEEASSATDLYAIGVLLYEMLLGKTPFPPMISELMKSKLGERPLDLSPLERAGFSSTVTGLVNSLLQTEPRKRPQKAKDLRKSLASLLQTTEEKIAPTKSKPKLRSLTLLWLLLIPLFLYLYSQLSSDAVLSPPKKRKQPLTIGRLSIDKSGATVVVVSCATTMDAKIIAVVRSQSEETILLQKETVSFTRNHRLSLSPLPAKSSLRLALLARSQNGVESSRTVTLHTGDIRTQFVWSSFGKILPKKSDDLSTINVTFTDRIHGHPARRRGNFAFHVDRRGLACLNVANKEVLWMRPEFWNVRPSASCGEKLFACDKEGTVCCLSWSDGKVLWSRKLETALHYEGFFSDGVLVLSSARTGLYGLSGQDGKGRWHLAGQVQTYECVLTPKGIFTRIYPQKKLLYVTASTGKTSAPLPLEIGTFTTTPISIGDEMVIANGEKLYLGDPMKGRCFIKRLPGKITHMAHLGDDIILSCLEPPLVCAISTSDGNLRWQRRLPIRNTSELTAARGKVYFIDDKEHLVVLSHASGRLLYRADLDLSDDFSVHPLSKGLLVCTDRGDMKILFDE